jgi:hypothetical protein
MAFQKMECPLPISISFFENALRNLMFYEGASTNAKKILGGF